VSYPTVVGVPSISKKRGRGTILLFHEPDARMRRALLGLAHGVGDIRAQNAIPERNLLTSDRDAT